MYVKRRGKNIFGAVFNSAEQKAFDIEARKQMAEYDAKNSREVDAIILWILHDKFKWGPKRLRALYDEVEIYIERLIKYYGLEEHHGDGLYMCTKFLKDYGIDLKKWEAENDAKRTARHEAAKKQIPEVSGE